MTAGGRELQVPGAAQLKNRLSMSIDLKGTSRNRTVDDRSDRVPLCSVCPDVPTKVYRYWCMLYLEHQLVAYTCMQWI